MLYWALNISQRKEWLKFMSLKVYSCPHGCNRGATFARYVISVNKLNASAAEVIVNGRSAGVLAFALYTLDVTPFLTDGENTVSRILLSGNRNLLGAHRKPYGESNAVGPLTFSDGFYRCGT